MDLPTLTTGSTAERGLQERYGTEARAAAFYDKQVLDHLNPRMREFITEQEMVFVSTADSSGDCDNTFRAGPPGFVRVVDERTLAYPEYRGNGVMASLANISENGHAALLFVDFLKHIIGLHVNGIARIMESTQARAYGLERFEHDGPPGRKPERWVVIGVEEAYIHCGKHIPRMARRDRKIDWGTDDVKRKGGDFFCAAAEQSWPRDLNR